MAVPMSSLAYPALDDASRQMRLIRFETKATDSCDGTTPIRCCLAAVSLEEAARQGYRALSYCWGDVAKTAPVQINGVLVNILANLEAALRRICRAELGAAVWADALCIHQNDLSEKACQVNLMARIFSQAALGVIWLGDTTPQEPQDSADAVGQTTADRAFALLEALSRDEHYSPRDGRRRDDGGAAALGALLRLSWWHRIWTVQEAILPPESVVLCGPLKVSWAAWVQASRHFQEHHRRMCCSRAVSSLKLFQSKITALEESRDRRPSLGRLLHKFRDRAATDPRDKVFGLLALSARADLAADYRATTRDVFMRAARALIGPGDQLDLLLGVREYQRNPHLPSWVPDWTAVTDRHGSRELTRTRAWDLHDASGGRTAQVRPAAQPDALELAGVEADVVANVGEPCMDHQPFAAAPEQAIAIDFPDARWRRLVVKTASLKDPYPLRQDETYAEAFMRVLAMDYVEMGDEDDDDDASTHRIRPEDVDACLREVNSPYQTRTYYQSKMLNRRFFVTQRGRLGTGPVDTAVGDGVFVLLGGQLPFLLRRTAAEPSLCRLVGDAYVHGIMDGEALQGTSAQWVSLV